MATLTQILHQRSRATANLEKGLIYTFTPGTMYTPFGYSNCCMIWQAPSNGVAVIELWGASGSGARMCCCGHGLSGNPGGFVRKTLDMCAGDWVRGLVGLSCGNADALCFRGCSQSTCMTVCRVNCNECLCLCAEGGHGGWGMCSTTTSGFCCFGWGAWLAAECFREKGYPGSCGLACNWCNGRCMFGRAFGGDMNCCGGWSCASFVCAEGNSNCYIIHHLKTSPHIISDEGAVISFNSNYNSGIHADSGGGIYESLYGLGLATKRPNLGHAPTGCWMGNKHCGCYEAHGCNRFHPPGVPGVAFTGITTNVRAHASTGGHGMLRIKFIGNS